MRTRLILAGLLGAAILVALYTIFFPTFNAPVSADAVGFEQESRLLERLSIAEGYRISLFATGAGKARVIRQTAAGNFIVTAARDGQVRLVRGDHDNDGRSDGVELLASELQRPHGLLIEGNDIFIAESHRVSVFQLINEQQTGNAKLRFERTVLDGIPDDGGHSTRTIGRGPDGQLYVTVGSSCNVCIEDHPWRAAIIRLGEAGKPEIFARGLRNSVGFDWQPGTGNLYAVNAGSDLLGDDFPREEMNLVVAGGHYGWPYAHEDNVPDPDLGNDRPADLTLLPPAHLFTAHSTPLSIRFLRHQKNTAPGRMALVARHGSWNRSEKSGYDVVQLHWQADGSIVQSAFITGFEAGGDVTGRPVDVYETPDGGIYITDDFANVVYRVQN